ncbi:MAG: lipid-A-disaccharide synthase [Geminicoccaceae bacterium]|nr:MAG: lipid-A-disaccharide synthase [Geminicoccaceae bacterium]
MTLRVFVVAGETSGDFLAARLLQALGPQVGGLELDGVGGAELAKLGLNSRFSMDELSLMGFAEVVPHLPRLIRRLRETAQAARAMRPDLVLTVDAPAFTLRVLGRLRDLDAVKVHYVAPQAWAWRPGRAAKLRGLVDRLLAVLPFEPAFFAAYGVEAVHVGHPIVEQVPALPAFMHRERHMDPVLCLLPGSRTGEIRRHVPLLRATVALLQAPFPELRCVLPTPPAKAALVADLTGNWPTPLLVEAEPERRFARYAEADLALAASGTVGLELALARLPTVVLYRTSWLTAALARRLIRVKYVSLINLVADALVVPELLQERCTPETLAAAAQRLLGEPEAWQAQRRALDAVAHELGAGAMAPSARAAAEVFEALGR